MILATLRARNCGRRLLANKSRKLRKEAGEIHHIVPIVNTKALQKIWGDINSEKFDRDYPVFLNALATALKAGKDPVAAIEMTAQLFPRTSVLGNELHKLISALRRGLREEQALNQFAVELCNHDVSLFRAAINLSSRHGAPLTEALYRLAQVTRTRQSFRRKVNTSLALQRISSYAIFGSVCLITFAQWAANPQGFSQVIADSSGRSLLVLSACLTLTGCIWTGRLGRFKY